MKHSNIAKISLIALLSAAILTSCKDTTEPGKIIDGTEAGITEVTSVEYKSVTVRDYEPCHTMKMPTYFDSAEIDGNTYQFHPDVSDTDRQRFIESQSALLALLGEKTGKSIEGYTFRVFGEYVSRSDSENSTAYYGMDDLSTWRQALATAQMIYGDTTVYGYMYAMADDLATSLNWKADVKTKSKSMDLFKDMPEYLTLTYPCFASRYSTNTQTNAAITLSLELFSKMDDPYSGEYWFVAGAKNYAAENNIQYPTADFRFTSAGDYYVMGIETKYYDIIIDSTFEFDYLYTGFGYYYDSWETSVATLYAKLTELEGEAKQVKKLISAEPAERLTVRLSHGGDIYSAEEFSTLTYSFHEDAGGSALTMSVNIATEIYTNKAIETVGDSESLSGWCWVLLSMYLNRENTCIATINSLDQTMLETLQYFSGTSFEKPEDLIKYYEYRILLTADEIAPKYWLLSETIYWEALAFADYLLQELGENSFIQLMLHPNRYAEYGGKTLYQLLNEWETYMLEKGPEKYPTLVDPYLLYLPTTTTSLWTDTHKDVKSGTNTFRFDSSLSADDRTSILGKQNQLFDLIETKLGVTITDLTVNVATGSDPRSHSDTGLIFFGKDDVGTWKQVIATLGAIYGDYTTYGYMYAMANDLAGQLSWECDTAGGNSNTALFENNPQLCSLASPAFHPLYSTDEEITAAKALALETYKKMTSPYGGESEFTSLLLSYAESRGIGYTPTHVRFAYNGTTCPVKALLDNAEIFIDSTYTADTYYELGVAENWMQNITSMVSLLEEKDASLTEANKFFEYTPEFRLTVWLKDEVLCKYADGYVESLYGQYCFSDFYLFAELCTVDYIVHEYVHHIDHMIGYYSEAEDWTGEALAYYYTREESYRDFILTMTEDDSWYFSYYMGSEVDTLDEYIASTDISVYSWFPDYPPEAQLYTPYNQNSNTISIAAYIVRNWGEDKFYRVMLDPNLSTALLGKPLSEIATDWANYIITEVPVNYPNFINN